MSKTKSNILLFFLFLSMVLISWVNPIILSILVLTISLTVSLCLFKIFGMSWPSFILVIVYSSGMMVLFLYIVSTLNNQMKKNSSNLHKIVICTSLLGISGNLTHSVQMKSFSMSSSIILLTFILILSMFFISKRSYFQFQSMTFPF